MTIALLERDLAQKNLISEKMCILIDALYALKYTPSKRAFDSDCLFFIVSSFTRLCMLPKASDHDVSHNISTVFMLLGQILDKRSEKNSIIWDSLIQHLMTELLNKSPNARDVSTALYGMGLIANSGAWRHLINMAYMDEMLRIMLSNQRDASAQDLAYIFHGLGLLAQAELLENSSIDVEALQSFLAVFITKTHKDKDLSMIFYGLGLMSRAGVIRGQFVQHTFDGILEKLVKYVFKARILANVMYGLGLMAQANMMPVRTDDEAIKRIFYRLERLKPNAQDIANSFYGMGLIAQSGLLTQDINAERMTYMLERLLYKSSFISQHLANTMYGFGLIAQANLLKGTVNTRLMNAFSHEVLSSVENKRHLALFVYSMGLLSQAGAIDGFVDSRIITAMGARASTMDDEDRKISFQMMQGLVYLGHSLTTADREQLERYRPIPHEKQALIWRTLQQREWVEECSIEKLVGAHFVDVYLKHKNGKRFIIEFDGKGNHTLQNNCRVHQDCMRDVWLDQRGFTVLRYATGTLGSTLIDDITQDITRHVTQEVQPKASADLGMFKRKRLDLGEKEVPSKTAKTVVLTDAKISSFEENNTVSVIPSYF